MKFIQKVFLTILYLFIILLFLVNNHNFEKHVIKPTIQNAIQVVVFSCNRQEAIIHILNKLIEYRPNEDLFPIIVSQDCDHQPTTDAILSFGDQIEYIKHYPQKNLTGKKYAYHRIARHYKLTLDLVFLKKNVSTAIILEDDLDISSDIFSYFTATRRLLQDPKSNLYCVSAWNDNGNAEKIDLTAQDLLYRSDFFSGLGWMTTREIWKELSPNWPEGYWDDWMRRPDIRKGRQCIRPEIGRTAMTSHGKVGASKGQFFENYLKKIELNREYVNFSEIDLNYLMPEMYEKIVREEIRKATPMKFEDALRYLQARKTYVESIRMVVAASAWTTFRRALPIYSWPILTATIIFIDWNHTREWKAAGRSSVLEKEILGR